MIPASIQANEAVVKWCVSRVVENQSQTEEALELVSKYLKVAREADAVVNRTFLVSLCGGLGIGATLGFILGGG